MVEQKGPELVVPILRRDEQRAPAVVRHLVHVGAGREQNPHRFQIVRANREHQRREPAASLIPHVPGTDLTDDVAVVPFPRRSRIDGLGVAHGPVLPGRVRGRADVRAAVDEQLDGRRMSLSRRPHQGRRAPRCLFRVHVGAAIEQQLHRRDVAGPGRHHEHGVGVEHALVRVRSCVEQALRDGRVAVLRGQRQRRRAEAVGDLRVGAGFEEQIDGGEVVPIDGPMQRRRAIGLRRVHVRLLGQQPADRGRVAAHDGVRHVARGGTHTHCGQQQEQRSCSLADGRLVDHGFTASSQRLRRSTDSAVRLPDVQGS